MIRNYFKIAVRNLLRHKVFSLINIVGLAISIAACLLIVQYISFELSYDDFHEKADQVYRVRLDRTRNGVEDRSAGTAPGLGPALKKNFPEVSQFARVKNIDYMNSIVAYGDAKFNQKNISFVDSTFLSIFNFPVVKGESKNVLGRPYTALITASMAEKYFGDENPVNKVITISNGYGDQNYKIEGVLKDLPENTHLHFDFLLSYESLIRLDPTAKDGMGWNAFFTYVLLNPKVSPEAFEAKLNAFVSQILAEDMEAYNYKAHFILQALKNIHLYPTALRHDREVKGSRTTIYALSIIAFFIIVIAYFNYINLSTSRTMVRVKEVGIRKVVGSNRSQLIIQFLFEAALLNFIAIVLAIALVRVSIPFFNQLAAKELSFSIFDGQMLVILTTLFFTGTLLSGLYPAIFFSSFKPISVLKGKTLLSGQGLWLRKSLVVMQFTASVILIGCTMAVYQQVNFMRNKELGVDIERTLVLKGPGIPNDMGKMDGFKHELNAMPGFKSITTSSVVPGQEITAVNNIYKISEENPDNVSSYSTHLIHIDYDFLKAYEIDVIEGRNFLRQFSTDDNAIILSKTLFASLAYETFADAIGQRIKLWGNKYEIIGITEDFHQNSLKSPLLPIAFLLQEHGGNYHAIKIDVPGAAGSFKKSIAAIETKWKAFFPGTPFEYFFLDDYFNSQYRSEVRFGKVFSLFTSLAILIACMGLFGLSSFNTSQRVKEIGIRKILGASISGILRLLSKDLIQLILIAILFSWPITYISIQKWLENYPYKMAISWWLFAIPPLLVLIIAFSTVSYQSLKAALANPVESLRNE